MKGPKKGKGIDLKAALDDAAKQIDPDALGEYKVEFTVIVGNPKIREYVVTLVPTS
ncbi:MAG: hypothetical protein M3P32_05845 [Chloroflexota bacterium]|nr:hypothetical protein [Chloroflexota bacterium]